MVFGRPQSGARRRRAGRAHRRRCASQLAAPLIVVILGACIVDERIGMNQLHCCRGVHNIVRNRTPHGLAGCDAEEGTNALSTRLKRVERGLLEPIGPCISEARLQAFIDGIAVCQTPSVEVHEGQPAAAASAPSTGAASGAVQAVKSSSVLSDAMPSLSAPASLARSRASTTRA